MVGDLLGDAVDQLAGVDEGPHGDLGGVEPVREGLEAAVEVRHVPHVLLHLRLQRDTRERGSGKGVHTVPDGPVTLPTTQQRYELFVARY